MKFLEENLIERLQRPEFNQLREAFVTRSYPGNSFVCQPDSRDGVIQRQGRCSFVIADLAALEKHCRAAGCL